MVISHRRIKLYNEIFWTTNCRWQWRYETTEALTPHNILGWRTNVTINNENVSDAITAVSQLVWSLEPVPELIRDQPSVIWLPDIITLVVMPHHVIARVVCAVQVVRDSDIAMPFSVQIPEHMLSRARQSSTLPPKAVVADYCCILVFIAVNCCYVFKSLSSKLKNCPNLPVLRRVLKEGSNRWFTICTMPRDTIWSTTVGRRGHSASLQTAYPSDCATAIWRSKVTGTRAHLEGSCVLRADCWASC